MSQLKKILSGFEKYVFQKHKASLQSPSNEKDLLRVLFTLKLRLFLLPFKVFFFLQSANGLKVYLKSSECLKTETVVNVGAICQYNYSGERSVFINKQDQFFSQG